MSYCSWCGDHISEAAEGVYRRGQGRYPQLCESCMLWEMDRRASGPLLCESCGSQMDFFRRLAIRDMEREGISRQRLCLACLRKQLDAVVSDPHRSPTEAMTQVLLEDDWLKERWPLPPKQSFEVACPWCLVSLSSEKMSKLRKGELVNCDYCGTVLTSDIL